MGDEIMKASELFDLAGQVALVTGASSGLGVRFARVLAANGAKIALVARRADRLADVKATIEAAGGHAVAIEADVLDRAAMERAFEAAEQAFGTVTILINNAGVAHGGRAVDLPSEEWRRVLSTNLDAVFFWGQEAARRMLAAKARGAIVNIASILGFGVSKGAVAYATAKAGVVQLTKALAIELAFRGIRVNAIAPGYVKTDMAPVDQPEFRRHWIEDTPQQRYALPEEIAPSVVFLASDAAAFMTGSVLVIDGGYTIW